jgi:hypothetical protein
VDPGDAEDYARAAARLIGLAIDDAWWPAVARHVAVLLDHAAGVEAAASDLPADPAPVFRP